MCSKRKKNFPLLDLNFNLKKMTIPCPHSMHIHVTQTFNNHTVHQDAFQEAQDYHENKAVNRDIKSISIVTLYRSFENKFNL